MVTVIIPNYNHAKYLKQRIDSVLNQTYVDFNLIILDDCSTDNSRDIIDQYKTSKKNISVIYNEKNSGNTFKQWNKGIAAATGEYIWLAESDDYADSNFLSLLVAQLDANPSIGIAYGDSIVVDENGIPLREIKDVLNDSIKTNIWNQNFVMNGPAFLKEYMSFANAIPNASAVLLRKSVLDLVGPADDKMRLAGDWVHWNKMLYISDISYLCQPINYFRTHNSNVRSNTLKNGLFLEEISKVMIFIKSMFPNESYNLKSINLFIDYWIYNYQNGYISFAKNMLIARNIIKISNYNIILFGRIIKFFLVKKRIK